MALRGTNQEFGRPYNRRIVLEAIRATGPTTRGRIAAAVGLTVQTVSTIIRELEEQGYILSEPRRAARPRPAAGDACASIPRAATPSASTSPRSASMPALINLAGEIIGSATGLLRGPRPTRPSLLIGAMVKELRALRHGVRMLGVGLSLPGPFGVESMSFVGPTTMVGWNNVQLRERLAEVTGLPRLHRVRHGRRRARRAALRPRRRVFADFYYLFVGVGLGGIMVHEGGAQRGAWGNAGEISHIPARPRRRALPCGNRGCLERYVSLEAFARRGAQRGGLCRRRRPATARAPSSPSRTCSTPRR